MHEYYVTIKATLIKSVGVEASSWEEAEELAHQEFTLDCESCDDRYDQYTIAIAEGG